MLLFFRCWATSSVLWPLLSLLPFLYGLLFSLHFVIVVIELRCDWCCLKSWSGRLLILYRLLCPQKVPSIRVCFCILLSLFLLFVYLRSTTCPFTACLLSLKKLLFSGLLRPGGILVVEYPKEMGNLPLKVRSSGSLIQPFLGASKRSSKLGEEYEIVHIDRSREISVDTTIWAHLACPPLYGLHNGCVFLPNAMR